MPYVRGGLCLVVFGILTGVAGCGTPVVKPEAFDLRVLARRPLPGELIEPVAGGERVAVPGTGWLGDIDPRSHLTFVGWRDDHRQVRFFVVVECNVEDDRLLLHPLREGETPLDVLQDGGRRRALTQQVQASSFDSGMLMALSLSAAISGRRLASPIPPPGRIYAVAANFPSHLQHDLAIQVPSSRLERVRRARARVFVKYPPTMTSGAWADHAGELLGPYDDFNFPAGISLPGEDGKDAGPITATRLDYEVEVAAVLGRSLTWETVCKAPDDEIREAIAGYLLISDTKARNPQVVDKVAEDDADQDTPEAENPYRLGARGLDRAASSWDQRTCRWWSYAAAWVNCTSLGPVFVAAEHPALPQRALISARSYATLQQRGLPLPPGRDAGTLYLRQCACLSEDPAYQDALIWNVPDIVRSILAPEHNALHFNGAPATLERGDVIALGTPGGVVITSKPQGLLDFLGALLFWWKPVDWHDAFFDRDAHLYLHQGDAVFHWAEGLGFQLHRVTRRAPQADAAR